MSAPSYSELVDRLEALEQRGVKLDDLPLAALMRKLADDWNPDARQLIGPGQIVAAQLGDDVNAKFVGTGGTAVKLRAGTGTVAFTASSTSAQVTVPHGMGSVPTHVYATAKQPANVRVSIQETGAPDGTNVYLTGFQSADVAITASQTFYWLALG